MSVRRWLISCGILLAGVAQAQQVASCAGEVLAGAAYLACSHTVPSAPTQLCNYTWSLQTDTGLHTFQGYFALLPGQANRVVFQAGNISAQIGGSIVLCQSALWEQPNRQGP